MKGCSLIGRVHEIKLRDGTRRLVVSHVVIEYPAEGSGGVFYEDVVLADDATDERILDAYSETARGSLRALLEERQQREQKKTDD